MEKTVKEDPMKWKPYFRRLDNPVFGENSDFDYATRYLLQHIKTGYPEIAELIENYKQFLINHGVTSGYITHKSNGIIENRPGIPAIRVTTKEKQEFENMVDLFVGKMRRLTRDVVDRIPLLGRCDGCPTSKISIKDGQEK
jgi:hypothetical protein